MPLSDSSQTYVRAVWPKPSPAVLRLQSCRRRLRGLPVLVHEVSRRVWGLRLRRTEQELALSFPFMLPSAHFYRVGVRVVSFRTSIPLPPILYLRFTASLTVAAQDSRPSGSLLLSCKARSSSTFMPVYPG